MMKKTIMTFAWSEANEPLKVHASNFFGRTTNKKPADFCEFVSAYPTVCLKRMYDGLKEATKGLTDVSSVIITTENSCLFDASKTSALEVVLEYLNILNSGKKIKSLWAYLDCEKKAIVHFVNKCGWYAEMFLLNNTSFSAVHLLEDEDGKRHFITANFTNDLSKLAVKVSLMGDFYLRDYLPRVKYDLLSKKGKKSEKSNSHAGSSANGKDEKFNINNSNRPDNWDGL